MDRPRTQYVTVGEADVAYQVMGNGPLDLLFCYGLGNHIELVWELLGMSDFLARMSSFSRLIFFDRRGTGASDGVPTQAIPTWEQLTEDISAVLQAVGSERAALMATLEVGPIAILYAAMHPEVVTSLVLLNASARFIVDDDYPIGVSPDFIETLVGLIAATWGTDDFARLANPSMVHDEDYIRRAALLMRASATPRSAAAQYRVLLRDPGRPARPTPRPGTDSRTPGHGLAPPSPRPRSVPGRAHKGRLLCGAPRRRRGPQPRRLLSPERRGGPVLDGCHPRHHGRACAHHSALLGHRRLDRAGRVTGRHPLADAA